MKKTIDEIKYWGQIFLLPIYALSFLVPRSKKIWVFGSTFGRRFADNPKYFYLYVSSLEKEDIRPIWITKVPEIEEELRNSGYEVYRQKSIKGIWYSLRAAVYVFDNYSKDISFLCSGRAKKINLWHGIPLKMIQMDNKFDRVRHPENRIMKARWFLRRISDEKPSHYILTTSEHLRDTFSSAFNTKRVLVANYPRNDNLIKNHIPTFYSKEEEKIVSLLEQNERKKTILYMPTFRDSEEKFFTVVQTKQLIEFLEKEDIQLIIKLHPKSKLKSQFESLKGTHIIHVSAETDPYTFLGKVDALITDYSSIYFDFLLTGKPILFFDYDRIEYLTQSREMYYDYDSITPGRKVETMEELLQAIKTLDSDEVLWREKRKQIMQEVFSQPNQFGSKRLFELVKEIVKVN